MAVPAATNFQPLDAEQCTFQRVRVAIYGRYMLQDRSEHPCRVLEMSPGDVLFKAERIGRPGERVVAYLDHIGRIEGRIIQVSDDGFAMTVLASERKRDKLASQLTWLANRHELDLPEDRRHDRITPRNPFSLIQLPDGRQYPCRIVDLSVSGAALEVEPKPGIGGQLLLASIRCEVVRHFDDGIAVEFAEIQDPTSLKAEFSE